MKSKKLVVFIVILVFLTVLVVLNSTLFTLQYASVNWLTTKYKLQDIKDDYLTSDMPIGDSIFLLKKSDISAKLEKEYPYLRVVSIETKFPNKIVLHTAERESLFAIELSNDEYAEIDEKGKVLTLTTSKIFAGSDLGAKPIRTTFLNISLNPSDFVVGEQIKDENIVHLLSQLSYSLRESNYTPATSKGVFLNMSVNEKGGNCDIILETRNGMKLELSRAETFTTDKFLLGLNQYNEYHRRGVVSGTISVANTQNTNEIFATFDPNKK